ALLDVAVDARAGADDGAVANIDVVGDADLAGHHHVTARGAGAGDADLADEHVVRTDLAVVGDHHQVVDLGSRPDARRLKRAAVDGRAGADLHVRADLDVAQLRHLDVLALVEAVTEPV